MKIAVTISRILLGLIFTVFGLNGFLQFIPQPPLPEGLPRQFLSVMTASHFLLPAFAVQLVCGLLFLANRFVFLALLCIAPVIVNILTYHVVLAPETIAPGLVATVLWLVVAYWHRSQFAPIFRA